MRPRKKLAKKPAKKRLAKKAAHARRPRPPRKRPTTLAERETERQAPAPALCNEKELAFLDEWMGPSRFNGTRAIMAAHISDQPNTAAVYACEYLNRPHVLEEIESRRRERAKALAHTAERLLEEQLAVALATIGDVVDWNGRDVIMMPAGSLDDSTLAAIAEVSLIPGKFGDRMTVRMHDKLGAIAAIQKQLTPTYQERRRNPDGSSAEGDGGITIYVDGGPTGLEVTVTTKEKDAA